MTETLNIVTNGDMAVVGYSSLLANAMTVLWGCVFCSIYRVVARLFRERQLVPRTSQLTTFSLLMAVASWGLLSLLFLPSAWTSMSFSFFMEEVRLPFTGILITFVILAVFSFLIFRKNQSSFRLKLVLLVLTIAMLLLASGLAVVNALVFTLGWQMCWRQLYLLVFLFSSYVIRCTTIANVALRQKTRELTEEPYQRRAECRQISEQIEQTRKET